jgi:hypothetical protein
MRHLPAIPLCALLALGCGSRRLPPAQSRGSDTPACPAPPATEGDPARLPDVQGWRLLAEARLSQAGPHRGLLQRTYANAVAAAALDRGATAPWPDGSRFVKESLTRNGERVVMTSMSKEAGEWIWITGDRRGRVTGRYRGAASGACEACHYTQAWRFDGSFAPFTAGKASPELPPPAAKQAP